MTDEPMTRADILAESVEGDLIQLDGLDDAILGLVWNGVETVLAYSHLKCARIHMDQGMTWEDALEWISFNYPQGAGFPILVDDLCLEDFEPEPKEKQ